MKKPVSVWTMHCTNPKCGFHLERSHGQADVICQSCGGFVAVTEHIKFVEQEDLNYLESIKENNDLRSN